MMPTNAQAKFTKLCVSSFSTMKSIKLKCDSKQSTVNRGEVLENVLNDTF